MRDVDVAALQHTEVPYDILVEFLADDQSPLFQVMLVMQGAPPTEVTLPGLDVTVDELSTGAAKFDLQVNLTDRGDHLDGLFVNWIGTTSAKFPEFVQVTVCQLTSEYLGTIRS